MKCPLCKSENTEDASIYEDNGIVGPGYNSVKTFDTNVCNDCGVYFKTIEK